MALVETDAPHARAAMDLNYTVYGLRVASNCPLPQLVPITTPQQVDLQIRFGETPTGWNSEEVTTQQEPWRVSPYPDETGEPVWRVWRRPSDFYFRFYDGNEFILNAAASALWVNVPSSVFFQIAVVRLLGPILGFVLRQRGVLSLHASVVAARPHPNAPFHAIALVGADGAGKSTTAAALLQLGYPMLTGDIAALSEARGAFWIQPGFPRMFLWYPAVAALYGSIDALPRIVPEHPTWAKQQLELNAHEGTFYPAPLPLRAIYLLDERRFDGSSHSLTPMSPRAALLKLVPRTRENFLLDAAQRAAEFNTLSRLVKTVPVREVHARQDLSALPDLCAAILDDFSRTHPKSDVF